MPWPRSVMPNGAAGMAEAADLEVAAEEAVDFGEAVAAPVPFAEEGVAVRFAEAAALAVHFGAEVMAEGSAAASAVDTAGTGDTADSGAGFAADSDSAGVGPDTGRVTPMIPTITDTRMDTRPTMDIPAPMDTIRMLAGLTQTDPPLITRRLLLLATAAL